MLKIKYISSVKISIILLYMDVRQSNNKIKLSHFIQYIYYTDIQYLYLLLSIL